MLYSKQDPGRGSDDAVREERVDLGCVVCVVFCVVECVLELVVTAEVIAVMFAVAENVVYAAIRTHGLTLDDLSITVG